MTSIIATGCAGKPSVIDFEQEKISIGDVYPIEKCKWPELRQAHVDGQKVLYMLESDIALQRQCQIVEQTNYDIARTNAESLQNAVDAFNALVDKAYMHNEYAQYKLEDVDTQRREAKLESTIYKAALVIALIAVSL